MSSLRIRHARERDALSLAHLYPHWGIERCKKRIKKSISSQSEYRYFAELDGEIVGHICVKFGTMHHEHIATLCSLIVEEKHREKGIAAKLMEHSIQNLPEKIEIVLLQVQHDNEPAKSLFEKLGFEQYGYLSRAFKRKGEYKDNILMAKRL